MSGPPDRLGRTAAPRRGRRFLAGLATAFAFSLAACAAIDPPPAPVSVAPPAAPHAVAGTPASPERKRLIEAFGGVYSAPATEAISTGSWSSSLPPSDAEQPYRVTILNSPIVNAFALPSGDIFVTRGLLALADDTSEIAAVMAHEIGHITARHAAQRAELEKTAALFTRVNAQLLAAAPGSGRGRGAHETVDRQLFPPAGIRGRPDRHQRRSPRRDTILMRRRASSPRSAAGARCALRSSGAGSADKPDMMATHPSTPERIAQAIAEARQFGAPGSGETGRDAYLAAIDGIAFGDNPAQGVVRDTPSFIPSSASPSRRPTAFRSRTSRRR